MHVLASDMGGWDGLVLVLFARGPMVLAALSVLVAIIVTIGMALRWQKMLRNDRREPPVR
jgi:hypothetical protein